MGVDHYCTVRDSIEQATHWMPLPEPPQEVK
ncbi:DUF551 domain-containing protein [Escherichia coli]|nr:DUF551 domain-containing protein [Escherichia coli]QMS23018.1 DUF551 domain-containing protein [Escherichia coli]